MANTAQGAAPGETDVPDPGAAPGLPVAAVARRLGVAPATLRTWDRRYGLGPSEHRLGAHRRYSVTDVARLDQVRRLINSGVTPGEAARAVQAAAPGQPPATPPLSIVAAPAPPGPEKASIRGLTRAANSGDTGACRAIITDSIEKRGVIWTWESLLAPVLIELGAEWAATGEAIEAEHLFTKVIESCIGTVIERLRTPVNVRPVLLASGPDELHALALTALAGALAERHIEVRLLGQRVPTDALVKTVQRCGPIVVFVWSQLAETGDALPLAALQRIRPAPAVVIGGPGWFGATPSGVERVYDLTEAVSRITRLVGE
ncbi:MAG: MerR family transcriptional regulator [Actinomycetota bacterium]|nr:MerR family transcriptional regulator [Actinomycetota bacterium]